MDLLFPHDERERCEFKDSATKIGFEELTAECTANVQLLQPHDRVSVLLVAWKKIGDYLTQNPYVPCVGNVVNWVGRYTLNLWFGRGWIACSADNKTSLIEHMMKVFPAAYITMHPYAWPYMFSIYREPWTVDYLNVNFQRMNETDPTTNKLEPKDSEYIKQEGISLILLRMVNMFDFNMIKLVKHLCLYVLLAWLDPASTANTAMHATPNAAKYIDYVIHIYLVTICESNGAKDLQYVFECIQRNMHCTDSETGFLEHTAQTIAKCLQQSKTSFMEFLNTFLLNVPDRHFNSSFGSAVNKYVIFLTQYQLRKLHSLSSLSPLLPHEDVYKKLLQMFVKQRESSDELLKQTAIVSETLFSELHNLQAQKIVYELMKLRTRPEWHTTKLTVLLGVISEEINILEDYKYNDDQPVDELLEQERELATFYRDFAKLLSKLPYLQQETWLTAFSLHPCKEYMDAVIKCGSRNLRAIKKQAQKFKPPPTVLEEPNTTLNSAQLNSAINKEAQEEDKQTSKLVPPLELSSAPVTSGESLASLVPPVTTTTTADNSAETKDPPKPESKTKPKPTKKKDAPVKGNKRGPRPKVGQPDKQSKTARDRSNIKGKPITKSKTKPLNKKSSATVAAIKKSTPVKVDAKDKDSAEVIYAAAAGAADNLSTQTEQSLQYPAFALINSVTDTEELIKFTDYDLQIAQYEELNRILSKLRLKGFNSNDILGLIISPRYKRLTWSIGWKLLKKRCRELLTKDKKKTQLVQQYMADANDRLTHLDIDYDKYKDKPQIDYGTIEIGYERFDTESGDDAALKSSTGNLKKSHKGKGKGKSTAKRPRPRQNRGKKSSAPKRKIQKTSSKVKTPTKPTSKSTAKRRQKQIQVISQKRVRPNEPVDNDPGWQLHGIYLSKPILLNEQIYFVPTVQATPTGAKYSTKLMTANELNSAIAATSMADTQPMATRSRSKSLTETSSTSHAAAEVIPSPSRQCLSRDEIIMANFFKEIPNEDPVRIASPVWSDSDTNSQPSTDGDGFEEMRSGSLLLRLHKFLCFATQTEKVKNMSAYMRTLIANKIKQISESERFFNKRLVETGEIIDNNAYPSYSRAEYDYLKNFLPTSWGLPSYDEYLVSLAERQQQAEQAQQEDRPENQLQYQPECQSENQSQEKTEYQQECQPFNLPSELMDIYNIIQEEGPEDDEGEEHSGEEEEEEEDEEEEEEEEQNDENDDDEYQPQYQAEYQPKGKAEYQSRDQPESQLQYLPECQSENQSQERTESQQECQPFNLTSNLIDIQNNIQEEGPEDDEGEEHSGEEEEEEEEQQQNDDDDNQDYSKDQAQYQAEYQPKGKAEYQSDDQPECQPENQLQYQSECQSESQSQDGTEYQQECQPFNLTSNLIDIQNNIQEEGPEDDEGEEHSGEEEEEEQNDDDDNQDYSKDQAQYQAEYQPKGKAEYQSHDQPECQPENQLQYQSESQSQDRIKYQRECQPFNLTSNLIDIQNNIQEEGPEDDEGEEHSGEEEEEQQNDDDDNQDYSKDQAQYQAEYQPKGKAEYQSHDKPECQPENQLQYQPECQSESQSQDGTEYQQECQPFNLTSNLIDIQNNIQEEGPEDDEGEEHSGEEEEEEQNDDDDNQDYSKDQAQYQAEYQPKGKAEYQSHDQPECQLENQLQYQPQVKAEHKSQYQLQYQSECQPQSQLKYQPLNLTSNLIDDQNNLREDWSQDDEEDEHSGEEEEEEQNNDDDDGDQDQQGCQPQSHPQGQLQYQSKSKSEYQQFNLTSNLIDDQNNLKEDWSQDNEGEEHSGDEEEEEEENNNDDEQGQPQCQPFNLTSNLIDIQNNIQEEWPEDDEGEDHSEEEEEQNNDDEKLQYQQQSKLQYQPLNLTSNLIDDQNNLKEEWSQDDKEEEYSGEEGEEENNDDNGNNDDDYDNDDDEEEENKEENELYEEQQEISNEQNDGNNLHMTPTMRLDNIKLPEPKRHLIDVGPSGDRMGPLLPYSTDTNNPTSGYGTDDWSFGFMQPSSSAAAAASENPTTQRPPASVNPGAGHFSDSSSYALHTPPISYANCCPADSTMDSSKVNDYSSLIEELLMGDNTTMLNNPMYNVCPFPSTNEASPSVNELRTAVSPSLESQLDEVLASLAETKSQTASSDIAIMPPPSPLVVVQSSSHNAAQNIPIGDVAARKMLPVLEESSIESSDSKLKTTLAAAVAQSSSDERIRRDALEISSIDSSNNPMKRVTVASSTGENKAYLIPSVSPSSVDMRARPLVAVGKMVTAATTKPTDPTMRVFPAGGAADLSTPLLLRKRLIPMDDGLDSLMNPRKIPAVHIPATAANTAVGYSNITNNAVPVRSAAQSLAAKRYVSNSNLKVIAEFNVVTVKNPDRSPGAPDVLCGAIQSHTRSVIRPDAIHITPDMIVPAHDTQRREALLRDKGKNIIKIQSAAELLAAGVSKSSLAQASAEFAARATAYSAAHASVAFATRAPTSSVAHASTAFVARAPTSSMALTSAALAARVPTSSVALASTAFVARAPTSSMAPASTAFVARAPISSLALTSAALAARVPTSSVALASTAFVARAPTSSVALASTAFAAGVSTSSVAHASTTFAARAPTSSMALASTAFAAAVSTSSANDASAAFAARALKSSVAHASTALAARAPTFLAARASTAFSARSPTSSMVPASTAFVARAPTSSIAPASTAFVARAPTSSVALASTAFAAGVSTSSATYASAAFGKRAPKYSLSHASSIIPIYEPVVVEAADGTTLTVIITPSPDQLPRPIIEANLRKLQYGNDNRASKGEAKSADTPVTATSHSISSPNTRTPVLLSHEKLLRASVLKTLSKAPTAAVSDALLASATVDETRELQAANEKRASEGLATSSDIAGSKQTFCNYSPMPTTPLMLSHERVDQASVFNTFSRVPTTAVRHRLLEVVNVTESARKTAPVTGQLQEATAEEVPLDTELNRILKTSESDIPSNVTLQSKNLQGPDARESVAEFALLPSTVNVPTVAPSAMKIRSTVELPCSHINARAVEYTDTAMGTTALRAVPESVAIVTSTISPSRSDSTVAPSAMKIRSTVQLPCSHINARAVEYTDTAMGTTALRAVPESVAIVTSTIPPSPSDSRHVTMQMSPFDALRLQNDERTTRRVPFRHPIDITDKNEAPAATTEPKVRIPQSTAERTVSSVLPIDTADKNEAPAATTAPKVRIPQSTAERTVSSVLPIDTADKNEAPAATTAQKVRIPQSTAERTVSSVLPIDSADKNGAPAATAATAEPKVRVPPSTAKRTVSSVPVIDTADKNGATAATTEPKVRIPQSTAERTVSSVLPIASADKNEAPAAAAATTEPKVRIPQNTAVRTVSSVLPIDTGDKNGAPAATAATTEPKVRIPQSTAERTVSSVLPIDTADKNEAPAATTGPKVRIPQSTAERTVSSVLPIDTADKNGAPAATTAPKVRIPQSTAERTVSSVLPIDTADKNGATAATTEPKVRIPQSTAERTVSSVLPIDTADKNEAPAPTTAPKVRIPQSTAERTVSSVLPIDTADKNGTPAATAATAEPKVRVPPSTAERTVSSFLPIDTADKNGAPAAAAATTEPKVRIPLSTAERTVSSVLPIDTADKNGAPAATAATAEPKVRVPPSTAKRTVSSVPVIDTADKNGATAATTEPKVRIPQSTAERTVSSVLPIASADKNEAPAAAAATTEPKVRIPPSTAKRTVSSVPPIDTADKNGAPAAAAAATEPTVRIPPSTAKRTVSSVPPIDSADKNGAPAAAAATTELKVRIPPSTAKRTVSSVPPIDSADKNGAPAAAAATTESKVRIPPRTAERTVSSVLPIDTADKNEAPAATTAQKVRIPQSTAKRTVSSVPPIDSADKNKAPAAVTEKPSVASPKSVQNETTPASVAEPIPELTSVKYSASITATTLNSSKSLNPPPGDQPEANASKTKPQPSPTTAIVASVKPPGPRSTAKTVTPARVLVDITENSHTTVIDLTVDQPSTPAAKRINLTANQPSTSRAAFNYADDQPSTSGVVINLTDDQPSTSGNQSNDVILCDTNNRPASRTMEMPKACITPPLNATDDVYYVDDNDSQSSHTSSKYRPTSPSIALLNDVPVKPSNSLILEPSSNNNTEDQTKSQPMAYNCISITELPSLIRTGSIVYLEPIVDKESDKGNSTKVKVEEEECVSESVLAAVERLQSVELCTPNWIDAWRQFVTGIKSTNVSYRRLISRITLDLKGKLERQMVSNLPSNPECLRRVKHLLFHIMFLELRNKFIEAIRKIDDEGDIMEFGVLLVASFDENFEPIVKIAEIAEAIPLESTYSPQAYINATEKIFMCLKSIVGDAVAVSIRGSMRDESDQMNVFNLMDTFVSTIREKDPQTLYSPVLWKTLARSKFLRADLGFPLEMYWSVYGQPNEQLNVQPSEGTKPQGEATVESEPLLSTSDQGSNIPQCSTPAKKRKTFTVYGQPNEQLNVQANEQLNVQANEQLNVQASEGTKPQGEATVEREPLPSTSDQGSNLPQCSTPAKKRKTFTVYGQPNEQLNVQANEQLNVLASEGTKPQGEAIVESEPLPSTSGQGRNLPRCSTPAKKRKTFTFYGQPNEQLNVQANEGTKPQEEAFVESEPPPSTSGQGRNLPRCSTPAKKRKTFTFYGQPNEQLNVQANEGTKPQEEAFVESEPLPSTSGQGRNLPRCSTPAKKRKTFTFYGQPNEQLNVQANEGTKPQEEAFVESEPLPSTSGQWRNLPRCSTPAKKRKTFTVYGQPNEQLNVQASEGTKPQGEAIVESEPLPSTSGQGRNLPQCSTPAKKRQMFTVYGQPNEQLNVQANEGTKSQAEATVESEPLPSTSGQWRNLPRCSTPANKRKTFVEEDSSSDYDEYESEISESDPDSGSDYVPQKKMRRVVKPMGMKCCANNESNSSTITGRKHFAAKATPKATTKVAATRRATTRSLAAKLTRSASTNATKQQSAGRTQQFAENQTAETSAKPPARQSRALVRNTSEMSAANRSAMRRYNCTDLEVRLTRFKTADAVMCRNLCIRVKRLNIEAYLKATVSPKSVPPTTKNEAKYKKKTKQPKKRKTRKPKKRPNQKRQQAKRQHAKKRGNPRAQNGAQQHNRRGPNHSGNDRDEQHYTCIGCFKTYGKLLKFKDAAAAYKLYLSDRTPIDLSVAQPHNMNVNMHGAQQRLSETMTLEQLGWNMPAEPPQQGTSRQIPAPIEPPRCRGGYIHSNPSCQYMVPMTLTPTVMNMLLGRTHRTTIANMTAEPQRQGSCMHTTPGPVEPPWSRTRNTQINPSYEYTAEVPMTLPSTVVNMPMRQPHRTEPPRQGSCMHTTPGPVEPPRGTIGNTQISSSYEYSAEMPMALLRPTAVNMPMPHAMFGATTTTSTYPTPNHTNTNDPSYP